PEVLKLFENGLPAPQRLAIARTDKAWFIALSDFAGSWGDLFCFEEDGTLRWKAKLWIHGQLIRAETGYHDYHVTIVPAGEMVVVYGFGSKTHAAGFDTATGDARFRFHPAYWNWHKTPAQFRK